MSHPGVINDEAFVPKFTLPEPLVMADGTPVSDARVWREKRRPELLNLFVDNMLAAPPVCQKGCGSKKPLPFKPLSMAWRCAKK